MNDDKVPCVCCGQMTPVAECFGAVAEKVSPLCPGCLPNFLQAEGRTCSDD